MKFIKIGTGEPFKGPLPTSVSVLEKIQEPIPHYVETEVTPKDATWEQALVYFMFNYGYCLEADNQREVAVK